MKPLDGHGITALADVRSSSYSPYLPHFNKQALQAYLPMAEIRYVFLGAELGARPDNPDCYVDGKAPYEKIATTDAFQRGIERLLKIENVLNSPLFVITRSFDLQSCDHHCVDNVFH
ncbi:MULTISPECIES: DUF488 domain-containing protein [unclassified Synechocystis]|uniref:DUF488 domain-containing protein n=1 Tax=unclassified Synechocystis TaxID=2640012 RepID=UPI00048CD4A8|nr:MULTISPECIES: DUF488 domain-containing protein [unclassified Synechocystis]MCT0254987.1 DUF488 domain-containing protein [Synechocystis sp. CS-94]